MASLKLEMAGLKAEHDSREDELQAQIATLQAALAKKKKRRSPGKMLKRAAASIKHALGDGGGEGRSGAAAAAASADARSRTPGGKAAQEEGLVVPASPPTDEELRGEGFLSGLLGRRRTTP